MSFSELYITYYPKLVRFAKEFVILEEDAENITQDVFTDLWERKDSIVLVENINAYLFRLVKNRCLDYLRRRISEQKYMDYLLTSCIEMEITSECSGLEEKDAKILIRAAINSLPERCREIFLLSRLRRLKNKEISEKLGVSVNTVESQMGIALRKLRIKLNTSLAA